MKNDRRVLLLDSGYQVHDVVSWQNAVVKYVNGKAVKPRGHDEYYDIATTTVAFQLPTVLVLVTRVRIPYKRIAVTRENVLRRDNFECQYCGERLTGSTGTVDHVVPTSRGGKHKWGNVVSACRSCNTAKDNRTPQEAGLGLRCRPFVPTRDVIKLTMVDLKTHETWTRWIM